MGSHLQLWRGGLYDLPPELRLLHPAADPFPLPTQTAPPPVQANPALKPHALKPHALKRRVRIWEINTNLHCSVIGTCLSAAELRRVLVKLKIAGIETADEHELHMLGVLIANRPQEGGKLLQKTLDRRHQVALNQFAKTRDDATIGGLWKKAVSSGDIPGAYWAVLTHPDASDKMVQKAFGDVHMLSHLMGATNCADLQRMHKLEDELVVLEGKLERQQRHLRDGFTERDGKIARLSAMLAEKVQAGTAHQPEDHTDEAAALKDTIAELNDRLSRENARRERLEQRLSGHESNNAARRRAETERDAIRQELDAVERQVAALLDPRDDGSAPEADLGGATILYVGGRANQLPRFKALVERAGGELIHHDGGVEDASALLPGLVGRADVTLFPVDCISHNAMAQAKRVCQQLNKPFVPLRTSSLACLLSVLPVLARPELQVLEAG
jgi:hypothetical protein